MAMTPRENAWASLRFEGPERIPRETWTLPWVRLNIPETLEELNKKYPSDYGWAGDVYRPSQRREGRPFTVGSSTDDWGCVFENIHEGIHGEVKNPILTNIDDWKDVVKPPFETLPEDLDAARDKVNRACAESDLMMRAGCNPRPWERYQFIRGSEEAMMDVMFPEEGAGDILKTIHEFYLKELEFWVTTDVDSISFMDDWGSQLALLIPPPVWREIFKPMYKDYCDIAHAHGKSAFMHSDGHTTEIYPDIVEVGVDAYNSQLFVMDMAELAKIAKGKMTIWGEIDRQHILSAKDPQVGRDAVREVAKHFYDPRGGVIAQFEVSPGSHGPTALAIHDEWEKVSRGE